MPKIAEAARAARRDEIIAAGLACFAKTGYYATTMADVAAQAQVSKGTPYLYFESKAALFLALHEEWDCGAGQRVDAAIAALSEADRRSPRQILHAVAAAIAEHVVAESETCRVLMEARALAAHEPIVAAAVRDSDARTHRRLEDLIAAGVAAGEWPAGTDPALAARLFTASLYGLMAQWHLAPGSFSWEAAATALATGTREPADPGTGSADDLIRAGSVVLTPLAISDADEMVLVLGSEELYRFTGGKPPTLAELRARYARQVAGQSADGRQEWRNWIIRCEPGGPMAGYVQATIDDGGSRAEIAWVVGVAWQGRGLASAAARALVGWLDARGVAVIQAHIHPAHEASAAVARAAGLTPTGVLEDGELRWQRDRPGVGQ